MEIEYGLFVLLGFTASIISGVFGFGTALIVLAIGSNILPVKEAIVLGAVLFATSTGLKTVLYCKHIDWRITGLMALTSLPFAYLGATLLAYVPGDILKRLLGGMILLYLTLSMCSLLPKFKIRTTGLVCGSAAYGFVSGLLGSGNLIKVIIFREMNITKEAFVGAMAATSILSNIAKITAYAQTGLFSRHQLWPILMIVAGAIAAVLMGQQIVVRLSHRNYETGVQLVLALSALALIL